MQKSLFQDANEMELMKMYSVMDQVANAGALTRTEKKYLKQGLKIESSALNRVSVTITNNVLYFFKKIYDTMSNLSFYHFSPL